MKKFSAFTIVDGAKDGLLAALPLFALVFILAGMEALPVKSIQSFGCTAIGSFFSLGLWVLYASVVMLLFGVVLIFRGSSSKFSRIIQSAISKYCELAFNLTFSMSGALFALSLWYPLTKENELLDGLLFSLLFTVSGFIWLFLSKVCSRIDEETGAIFKFIYGEHYRILVTFLGFFLVASSFFFVYAMKSAFQNSVQC